MKQINLTKFTKHQLRDSGRNIGSMSAKTVDKYEGVILIAAIVVMTIKKAKLGFTMGLNDGTFGDKSQAIFEALTADTGNFFTIAFTHLALLGTQVADFRAAAAAAELGVIGAEAAKVYAKKALWGTLRLARGYINDLVLVNASHAEEIIACANMVLYTVRQFNKQELSVSQGTATGVVTLRSLVAKKANGKKTSAWYEWEMSVDGGVTWITLPPTRTSTTKVAGLAVDVKTFFRKRVTTVEGTTAWCNPMSRIVV